jgi:hypothetical protein
MDEADLSPEGQMVEELRSELVLCARAMRRARPWERFVALVVEAGIPDEAKFRALLPAERSGRAGNFFVLVKRESALEVLGDAAPQLLDWTYDEGEGPMAQLPLIQVARRGVRTGALVYQLFG